MKNLPSSAFRLVFLAFSIIAVGCAVVVVGVGTTATTTTITTDISNDDSVTQVSSQFLLHDLVHETQNNNNNKKHASSVMLQIMSEMAMLAVDDDDPSSSNSDKNNDNNNGPPFSSSYSTSLFSSAFFDDDDNKEHHDRNLQQGKVCYSNEECGTECNLTPDPGCQYAYDDTTNGIICPDYCGPGRHLYLFCSLYCQPSGSWGVCGLWTKIVVDDCSGDINIDDVCTPFGCEAGGSGTGGTGGTGVGGGSGGSGGVGGGSTGGAAANICTINNEGTGGTCTPYPLEPLTTVLEGCGDIECERCIVSETASGTECNSCSFCFEGDVNIVSFDCTNIEPGLSCSCDQPCTSGGAVGGIPSGSGGGSFLGGGGSGADGGEISSSTQTTPSSSTASSLQKSHVAVVTALIVCLVYAW